MGRTVGRIVAALIGIQRGRPSGAVWHTPPMPSDTRQGFALADWERAKRQARDHLVAVASRRGTTTYSDLCEVVTAIRLRPYSFAIVAFLNEICTEEDAAHGTMLASLVVRKDTGMPGDGFFGHADRLGRDAAQRRAFWEHEVERVYDVYSSGKGR